MIAEVIQVISMQIFIQSKWVFAHEKHKEICLRSAAVHA